MQNLSKSYMRRLVVWCLAFLAAASLVTDATAAAAVFKVASYNVENLFDAKRDGTEYSDYVPGGKSGWSKTMVDLKIERIARVLKDLDADIVALQEVESKAALDGLADRLRRKGVDYPYGTVSGRSEMAVGCAVLSRYRITARESIPVGRTGGRDILKVTVDIDGTPLVLFVNHWKSKPAPESVRMGEARVLRRVLSKLPPHTDYILLGDFNTNHDEFATLPADPALNDTRGRTGLHHVLETLAGGRPVEEPHLSADSGKLLHYNLWLEVDSDRRWSADYFGRRHSPDHILLPGALYDGKGISYVDNSFDRFDPDYLFSRGKIFRWQRADRGRGRHLGTGYSDHLPIFAWFRDAPFSSMRDDRDPDRKRSRRP